MGASAVQLARSIGARITGVCGTANIDYVRSIGADHVIDYKTDDWQQRDERFDVIFDAAAAATNQYGLPPRSVTPPVELRVISEGVPT